MASKKSSKAAPRARLPVTPAEPNHEHTNAEMGALLPAGTTKGDPSGLDAIAKILVATDVLCGHIETECRKWTERSETTTTGRPPDQLAESMRRIADYGSSVLRDYQQTCVSFASSRDPIVASSLAMLKAREFAAQIETIVALCRSISGWADTELTGALIRELNVAFIRLSNATHRVRDCSESVSRTIASGGRSPLSRIPPEVKPATDAVAKAAKRLMTLARLEATGTSGQPDPVVLIQDRMRQVEALREAFVEIHKEVDGFVQTRSREIAVFDERALLELNALLDALSTCIAEYRIFIETGAADAMATDFDVEEAQSMARDLQRLWETVRSEYEQLEARIEHLKDIVSRAPFRVRPDGSVIRAWGDLTERQKQVVAALVVMREAGSDGDHSAATAEQVAQQLTGVASDATVRRALADLEKFVVVGSHAVLRKGEASRGLTWYFLYEEAYQAYQNDARVYRSEPRA